MKAVLIAIQPKWCELIAIGKKTVEVRKTQPTIETPFKCYIYQTKRSWIFKLLKKLGLYQGKVVGEFICDSVRKGRADNSIQAYYHNNPDETCLTDQELVIYANCGEPLYFWHISELKLYDEPKALSEFRTPKNPHRVANSHSWVLDGYNKITRPPQSWCYVEAL